MQGDTQHPYSYDHDVADDGTVTFQCSTDAEKWPWLALHPFDPIVVQSINFWASVETATARGTWNPEKWSALAHMTWQCGEQGVGHAIRGVGKQTGRDGSPGFHIIFSMRMMHWFLKWAVKALFFRPAILKHGGQRPEL